MKRPGIATIVVLSLLLLALVLAGCAAPPSQPSPPQPEAFTEAQVVRIVDGDTIEVNIGSSLYKVRYIGIDTPEKDEFMFIEATAKNAELVGGKTVKLEKDVSETDKYYRLLRYVYVGNLFVNAELVRLGYAQVATYPPDVKYQDLFLEFQREAREAERGLWATQTAHPSSEGKYIGSTKSDKYHYPNCYWAQKIKPENLIWFSSVKEALDMGYVPCKVCNPPTTD